ncbi:MAG: hypothetical protein ACOYM3_23260 [Terrimicrobiaceae bacterium]
MEGKYDAVSNAASVYKKDGKLLCAMEFRVGEENEMLKKFFVLFKADGSPNIDDYNLIREFSGWNGLDPYWIQDNAGAEWPVSVVVGMEPGYKDPSKLYPTIKWVNTVGGASMPASSDRAAILAEFGSRFRALAGPQPVMNSRHTPVKTGAPSVPPARAPLPAPTRPPPGGVKHTQASCWDALQAAQPSASQAEIENLWYSIVTGDQATMTSADWARVADAISRLSVNAATADEEPMPF